MDKQLTHQGEPTLLLRTITEGQITVNPICAFIHVHVRVLKKTDRSKKKNSVCPLRWYLYISLWRTECGGWDKTACCRRPTLSSPSSLYLTVGREKLVLSSLFQLTLEREREGQHGLCLLLKKRHTLIHTSSSYAHFLFLMRVPVAGCTLALAVLSILTFCEHHTAVQIPTKHTLQTILLCK